MEQTAKHPVQLFARPWLINIAFVLMVLFLVGVMVVEKVPSINNLNRVVGMLIVLVYILNFFRQPHYIPVEIVVIALWLTWAMVTGFAVASNRTMFWSSVGTLGQQWFMMLAVSGLTLLSGKPWRSFAAIVVAALVIAGHIVATGGIAAANAGVRVSGIMNNANTMAQIMLLGIACLLYFWGVAKRKFSQISLIGFFFLMASMIVFSGSRKGFLCLVLQGAAWLWYCHLMFVLRNFKVMLMVILVVMGGYFGVRYVFEQTHLGDRFETAEDAGRGRLGLYEDGLKMFFSSPLAGIGLDNFRLHSRGKFEAHSSYMEILADTGAVGFMIYFSLFVFLWHKFRRISRNSENPAIIYEMGVFRAFMVTHLVISLGLPAFKGIFPNFMLATIIGYVTALDRHLQINSSGEYMGQTNGA